MKKTAAVVVLLAAAVFLAGCTSATTAGRDIARDSVRAHYEHHGDWSPGFGCFEKVSGYAYNTGNTSIAPVMLNFNLIDIRTGTIRDSRLVYLDVMEPGQSHTFETDLDGECVQDYRIDGSIV